MFGSSCARIKTLGTQNGVKTVKHKLASTLHTMWKNVVTVKPKGLIQITRSKPSKPGRPGKPGRSGKPGKPDQAYQARQRQASRPDKLGRPGRPSQAGQAPDKSGRPGTGRPGQASQQKRHPNDTKLIKFVTVPGRYT